MVSILVLITEETAKLPILIYRAITEKNQLKKKILTTIAKEAIIHMAGFHPCFTAVVVLVKFILSII